MSRFKSSLNLCSHVVRRLHHFVDGGLIQIQQLLFRMFHICAINVEAYIARRCLRVARSTSSECAFLLRHLATKVHLYPGDKVLLSIPYLHDSLEIAMP